MHTNLSYPLFLCSIPHSPILTTPPITNGSMMNEVEACVQYSDLNVMKEERFASGKYHKRLDGINGGLLWDSHHSRSAQNAETQRFSRLPSSSALRLEWDRHERWGEKATG